MARKKTLTPPAPPATVNVEIHGQFAISLTGTPEQVKAATDAMILAFRQLVWNSGLDCYCSHRHINIANSEEGADTYVGRMAGIANRSLFELLTEVHLLWQSIPKEKTQFAFGHKDDPEPIADALIEMQGFLRDILKKIQPRDEFSSQNPVPPGAK